MLKVLIADDEPEICELIIRLIDWDGLDLVLVGTAQHGLEVEHYIEMQKPDIVITDIQMPGMTGLELIEKYKDEPSLSFIVVSGYREFEHAQKALRFGAEDYLLKPIRRDDLNQILRQLVDRHNQNSEQIEHQKALRETLDQRTANLRGKELWQFVINTTFSLTIGNELNTALFSFESGDFLCVGFHVSFSNLDNLNAGVRQAILENLNSRLQCQMKADCVDMETAIHRASAYCVANYTGGEATLQKFLKVCGRIQREATVQYAGIRIAAAIGTVVNSPSQLDLAVQTTCAGLGLRLALGCDHVIRFPYAIIERDEICLKESQRQELVHALTILDANAATTCLRQIYRQLSKLESGIVHRIFNFSREIMDFISYTAWGSGTELHDIICRTEAEIENCISLSELEETLCRFASNAILILWEKHQSQDAVPIRLAKEYIQEHLQEQVSLEDVAKLSYLTPTYFSALFKEHTGETFSNYVIRLRVEAAKIMLKIPALSVNEIAYRVGYSDPRHFSKTFQKIIGVKPTAYRRFYC